MEAREFTAEYLPVTLPGYPDNRTVLYRENGRPARRLTPDEADRLADQLRAAAELSRAADLPTSGV